MARPKKEVSEEVVVVEKKSKEADSSKKRALDLAVAEIEKEFGKGSIMTINGYKDSEPAEHISSGTLAVDSILGKGGFVFGRVVEIYGAESSGKSTFCLELVARAQKLGLTCAYIDKENDLDADYAEMLGVNLEETKLSQPNTGEEALTIAERLINSGAVDVLILDSVASINPSADLEKSLSDNAKMAGRASLLTRFFDRNDSAIQKNKVLFVCINQMRDGLDPYGPKKTTPGGRALKHAASYRLEIHPKEKITGPNGEIIGNTVRMKTMKNKLNSPFKEVTYDLIFGKGIDKVKDAIDLGTDLAILEKAGSWYAYEGERFQGIPGGREFFADEAKFEALKNKIISVIGPDWTKEGKN